MAHYAILDENNVVLNVFVGEDETEYFDAEQHYVDMGIGVRIKRTSYNTYAGEHLDGGIPFRVNFAEVGGTYSDELDAFIPPKPFSQWVLNATTCQWEPPFPEPDDGIDHVWSEELGDWS